MIQQVRLTNRSVVHCSRCGARSRLGRATGWNFDIRQGFIAATICSACQTPMENAEAEINEATLDYQGTDAFGRLVAHPRASA